MGRGHGTLNIVKDKVYVVLSISVAAFSQSDARDAVADGVLTAAELKAHSETLRKAIRAGFTLRQGERLAPFSSILLNLPKGSHHALGRSTELTVMMVAPLPDKQAGHAFIAVQNTLWDPAESRLKLKATITVAGKISHREDHWADSEAEPTPLFRHRGFAASKGY